MFIWSHSLAGTKTKNLKRNLQDGIEKVQMKLPASINQEHAKNTEQENQKIIIQKRREIVKNLLFSCQPISTYIKTNIHINRLMVYYLTSRKMLLLERVLFLVRL